MLSPRAMKRPHNLMSRLSAPVLSKEPQKSSYDISDFLSDDDKENDFEDPMPTYVSYQSLFDCYCFLLLIVRLHKLLSTLVTNQKGASGIEKTKSLARIGVRSGRNWRRKNSLRSAKLCCSS